MTTKPITTRPITTNENKVRALVTNDDGIDSLGLLTLARAASAAGLDVLVAAPSWDSSGASASLTSVEQDGRFLVELRRLPSLDGVEAVAVEAAPAFIVRAAISGAFGPEPDVVLSGINQGPNTGHAVLHSGTVGAALTAPTNQLPAMAISIDAGEDPCWETARHVADRAIPWLLEQTEPVVLNVNVPNVPIDELRGFERAQLADFGAVQTVVTETGAGYVKLGYHGIDEAGDPGTDVALLDAGIACFTPLLSVCEARGVETESLALH